MISWFPFSCFPCSFSFAFLVSLLCPAVLCWPSSYGIGNGACVLWRLIRARLHCRVSRTGDPWAYGAKRLALWVIWKPGSRVHRHMLYCLITHLHESMISLKEPKSGVIRKACCAFPGSLGRVSFRVSRPGVSRSSGDPSVLECWATKSLVHVVSSFFFT